MLAEMPFRQYCHWVEYFSYEPRGEDRIGLYVSYAAFKSATLKGGDRVRVQDFMPDFTKASKSVEERTPMTKGSFQRLKKMMTMLSEAK